MRITPDSDVEQLEEKLDRMEGKLDRSRRRVFSCFNCLLYFVVIILVVFGYGAYVLAKSGMVDVPFLSDRVFVVPKPVHPVSAGNFTQLNDALTKQIVNQTAKDFLAGKTDSVADIIFTEAYLTSLMREKLGSGAGQNDEIIQAAVSDGSVEVFYHKQGNRAYLVADVIPGYADGKIKFTINSLRLGNQALPSSIGNFIIKIFIGDRLTQLNSALKTFGEITSISVTGQGVEVLMRLDKKSTIFHGF